MQSPRIISIPERRLVRVIKFFVQQPDAASTLAFSTASDQSLNKADFPLLGALDEKYGSESKENESNSACCRASDDGGFIATRRVVRGGKGWER